MSHLPFLYEVEPTPAVDHRQFKDILIKNKVGVSLEEIDLILNSFFSLKIYVGDL